MTNDLPRLDDGFWRSAQGMSAHRQALRESSNQQQNLQSTLKFTLTLQPKQLRHFKWDKTNRINAFKNETEWQHSPKQSRVYRHTHTKELFSTRMNNSPNKLRMIAGNFPATSNPECVNKRLAKCRACKEPRGNSRNPWKFMPPKSTIRHNHDWQIGRAHV